MSKPNGKKSYGFISMSVKMKTKERLLKLGLALTDPDLGSPTLDEVINKACTSLEADLAVK